MFKYLYNLKYLYKPKMPYMGAEKMDNIFWHHNGFPLEWCLRKAYRNSTLLMHHYPDLGSSSDWLKHIFVVFSQSESLPRCEGSFMSSVWNFCQCLFFRHLVRKLSWWCHQILAFFSGWPTCTWSFRESMTDYQS